MIYVRLLLPLALLIANLHIARIPVPLLLLLPAPGLGLGPGPAAHLRKMHKRKLIKMFAPQISTFTPSLCFPLAVNLWLDSVNVLHMES